MNYWRWIWEWAVLILFRGFAKTKWYYQKIVQESYTVLGPRRLTLQGPCLCVFDTAGMILQNINVCQCILKLAKYETCDTSNGHAVIYTHDCHRLTLCIFFFSAGASGSEGGLPAFHSRFWGICGLPSSVPEPSLQPLGNTKRRWMEKATTLHIYIIIIYLRQVQ